MLYEIIGLFSTLKFVFNNEGSKRQIQILIARFDINQITKFNVEKNQVD